MYLFQHILCWIVLVVFISFFYHMRAQDLDTLSKVLNSNTRSLPNIGCSPYISRTLYMLMAGSNSWSLTNVKKHEVGWQLLFCFELFKIFKVKTFCTRNTVVTTCKLPTIVLHAIFTCQHLLTPHHELFWISSNNKLIYIIVLKLRLGLWLSHLSTQFWLRLRLTWIGLISMSWF